MNDVVPEKACIYVIEANEHFVAPEHYSLYDDTADSLRYNYTDKSGK
jgi:hypothetical protein